MPAVVPWLKPVRLEVEADAGDGIVGAWNVAMAVKTDAAWVTVWNELVRLVPAVEPFVHVEGEIDVEKEVELAAVVVVEMPVVVDVVGLGSPCLSPSASHCTKASHPSLPDLTR
jgi:hypothetical protein